MPQRRWISRSVLLTAGVLTVAGLTACGGATPAPTGSAGTTTSTVATPTPAGTLEISPSSAAQLCDMIRPELSNFRVQGPTLGRISLNAMVHDWGLRNGGINGHVLADKAMIDRVTTESCPDVRTEALTALELPSLAAGLAF
ncbi:hypothetical protein [Nocardia sp. NPDC058633]|uniref:hypothetical protein n=1 Tax=Nocardia sp. NPDC058633 TaxID=3346568 RepID=UPI00366256B6